MHNYDTFVNKLDELVDGKELILSVRDLTPGTHQYCYKKVAAMVSAKADAYEQTLQIRFGRGQLHPKSYSIKVLKEMPIIPEK